MLEILSSFNTVSSWSFTTWEQAHKVCTVSASTETHGTCINQHILQCCFDYNSGKILGLFIFYPLGSVLTQFNLNVHLKNQAINFSKCVVSVNVAKYFKLVCCQCKILLIHYFPPKFLKLCIWWCEISLHWFLCFSSCEGSKFVELFKSPSMQKPDLGMGKARSWLIVSPALKADRLILTYFSCVILCKEQDCHQIREISAHFICA